MPRRIAPNLEHLRPPPADAARRGLCVATAADVGDIVRVEREQRLGRQKDAAPRLGLSVAALGALERGEGGTRLEAALALLADLGFDVVLVPRDGARSLQAGGG